MAKISQATFGGIFPRIAPRLIPENAATIAKDVSLDNGRLAPLGANVQALDHKGATFTTNAGTKTIYRHRNRDGSFTWLASNLNLHFAPSPVREDPYDRVYWTGDTFPRFTTGTAAAAAIRPSYAPNVSYKLGLPKPATAPAAIVTTSTTAGNATALARSYVFTYVSGFGEEGPPSPASEIMEAKQGDTVTLTFGDTLPATVYSSLENPARRRVYRTNSSGSFQFVADVSATAPTATDTVLDEAMGEQLGTSEYDAPPDDARGDHPDGQMLGLTAMPNGVLAGFSGRTLFFSESYLPHAFPSSYSLTTKYRIVGLASVSIGLLVLTDGKPALATGSSPAGMSLVEIDNAASCKSARSIVDMGDVAIYAGPDGLISAGEGGFQNISRDLWSRDQWVSMNPASMLGLQHAGRYLLFYDNGTKKGGYMVDFSTRSPQLVELGFHALAGFYDPVDGDLYVVTERDISSHNVQRFDAGPAKTYDWQSRELRIEAAINPGCAIVDAETYTGVLDPQGNPAIQFDLYGDGELRWTEFVRSDEMFRLPDGYRAKDFQLRVRGAGEINAIHVAESPQELAR